MIPNSNSAPFEQGDNIPKYYGGFQDIRSSHLPTFMVKVSEIISKHQEPNKEHDFKLAFVPRKNRGISFRYLFSSYASNISTIGCGDFLNSIYEFLSESIRRKSA